MVAISRNFRKNFSFNGRVEKMKPSKQLTIEEILKQLDRVLVKTSGKHPQFGGKKRKREPHDLNWSKKSMFFELPYWSHQQFKHNLDVMHIEENVCDSILGTMCKIEGKSKDTDKAKLDLTDLGIRSGLHLYKEGTH